VTPTRRQAYLIVIAALLLALAVIVLVRSRSLDDDLLAVIGLLGGVAVVIVSLPENKDK
jgi:hypothetical protein